MSDRPIGDEIDRQLRSAMDDLVEQAPLLPEPKDLNFPHEPPEVWERPIWQDDDLAIEYLVPRGETKPPARQKRRSSAVAAVAAAILVVVGVVVVADGNSGDVVTDPVSSPNVTEPPATSPAATDPVPSPSVTVPPVVNADRSGCSTSSTSTRWSRVCLDTAVFDGASMWGVTAGGPGLVAVGGDYEFWTSTDLQPLLEEGGEADAVVWTSPDGISWSRVPHDEAVFGGDGAQQIYAVTVGGPGLVAVGLDGTLDNENGNAAVWTSSDGFTWSRVPHDEAVFGGDDWQVMLSVTAGGPGLVAVGTDGIVGTDGTRNGEADAAVWTSPDGFIWTRVPRDEAIFGGDGEQQMASVTVGGRGLVAVGSDGLGHDGRWPGDAAVWTSPDGLAWSRVPRDEAVLGGQGEQRMLSVVAGGPGLVAVGSVVSDNDLGTSDGDSDAAVWTSVDGVTWSRVPHDEAVFGKTSGPYWEGELMRSVTVGGQGLVAVGGAGTDESAFDAAVWTSVDGVTWFRIPHDETVFGGNYKRVFGVAIGAFGTVVVGSASSGDDGTAVAVWNDR